MDFQLSDEHRLISEAIRRFVDEELIPLEPTLLKRVAAGGPCALTKQELEPLLAKCRQHGYWALDVPHELGGANLSTLTMSSVHEALGRSLVPFRFLPDSPNLHWLLAAANPDQRKRYLEPYARGETISAIAVVEPGGGSDFIGAMRTQAVRDGDDWVINGRKIWTSVAAAADFTIFTAVTERDAPCADGRSISTFIVEKGTPGFEVVREIPMLGGVRTYEIVFENCRLPAGQLLGVAGEGVGPMQDRITLRRIEIGARGVGAAERALSMLCEYANLRSSYGVPLAERQNVQWMVANVATRIHACRLMVQHAAWLYDRRERDMANTVGRMVKVEGTELATVALDHAMQTFGATGMTAEHPLQLMAQHVRLLRVLEVPNELQQWFIARRILGLSGQSEETMRPL